MKIKKLGVYFVVAMLMVSFALSNVDMNVYAEETKKIGIGNLTEEDLVAAWYFDEDSGDVVKDYKGNYDGTANGTTIVDTPYGKGRSFDGVDDYIQFDNTIIPVGEKSIRFKIKRNNSEILDAERIMSTTFVANEGGIGIWLLHDKTINIGIGGGEDYWCIRLKSTIDICDDKWHDVLFTWDGTTAENGAKLYIDNMMTPNHQYTSTSLDIIGQHNLEIGKFGDVKNYFKGDLSQIEIYNEYYTPPSAPTNLTVEAGNKKVKLSWDKVEGAERYIVKRSETEGGSYKTIAEDVKETSYTDTDVENGDTYYYVVCAVMDGEKSSNSNEVSATPKGSSSESGDKALLRITMSNGKINEYDLSMSDVEDFIDWYEDRDDPYYIIEKDYNIGPFESRKDYIVADKILQFEVMEYNE